MLAKLISVEEDEGGVAVVSLNGIEISAMDCLGYGNSTALLPRVGEEFAPEFFCLFDDFTTLDTVFQGNPEHQQKLEPTGLWSYRAYGKIVATDNSEAEAMVDCGVCLLPIPIQISNPEHLGEFIAFNIQRLDIWRK